MHGIATKEDKRFGDQIIQFEDPEGLTLELIVTPTVGSTSIRSCNSDLSAHRIAGLHSASAMLKSLQETRSLLVNFMGMTLHDKEGNRYRFKMKRNDSIGQFYDVVIDEQAENGRQGGGTIHHIAFRTPTDDEQKYWQQSLMDNGFSVTPIRDRKYFKSIYFHEPGGVLFEIATDPPGFTVDEAYDNLGHGLQLPDQYEPMRSEIEGRLPELQSDFKGNADLLANVNWRFETNEKISTSF
jgi:glyoxalase family protein